MKFLIIYYLWDEICLQMALEGVYMQFPKPIKPQTLYFWLNFIILSKNLFFIWLILSIMFISLMSILSKSTFINEILNKHTREWYNDSAPTIIKPRIIDLLSPIPPSSNGLFWSKTKIHFIHKYSTYIPKKTSFNNRTILSQLKI